MVDGNLLNITCGLNYKLLFALLEYFECGTLVLSLNSNY